jgi:hypothetical protein
VLCVYLYEYACVSGFYKACVEVVHVRDPVQMDLRSLIERVPLRSKPFCKHPGVYVV